MTLPTHFDPRPLVRALATCSLVTFWSTGAPVQAQVLPSGMNTVAGQVKAVTHGNSLTVTNSPNAIIHWNSFSIGAQNTVRFEQNSATSQVLNRVVGNDPSSILGSLSSNGRVWLLNQNGVLFGQGARIDVAGMVASTLNTTDANWLIGRHRLGSDGVAPASVVNQGVLRTSLGGQIMLIGGSVRNEGVLDAPGGQIVLAAGASIELADTAAPNVGVKISAAPGEVLNLGSLSAAGGRIDIQAGIINQDGIVRADSLSRGPAGEIVLSASQRLDVGADSLVSADGGNGGRVTLEGDQHSLRGQVSARGDAGAGGQVRLLGREIGLLDGARVDVSGQGGGGEVLLGGGQEGKDASVPNAQAVFFGRDAGIVADALTTGDGGRIILWSDEATRAFGTLSARGGVAGGDGGFIETSGGWLDARPLSVNLSAPLGRQGTWLLDPYNITIGDFVSDAGFDLDFTATADNSQISTGTLNAQLALGADVIVSTSSSGEGGQAGNITIDTATISPDAGVDPTGASLTLIADGNISMGNGSTIGSARVAFPVTFRAGRSGVGSISLASSGISTNGGDLTLAGYDDVGAAYLAARGADGTAFGVSVGGSTLDAGAGNVVIAGAVVGAGVESGGYGVLLNASTVIGGNVFLQGHGTGPGGDGIRIFSTTPTSIEVRAANSMSLEGYGDLSGVVIGNTATLEVSGPGTLSIRGNGLNASGSYGVYLDTRSPSSLGHLTLLASGSGGISVQGQSADSLTGRGIYIVGDGGPATVPGIDITGGGELALGTPTALGSSINTTLVTSGAWLRGTGALEVNVEAPGPDTGISLTNSEFDFDAGIVFFTNGVVSSTASLLTASAGDIDISSSSWQAYDSTTVSGSNVTLDGFTGFDLPIGGGTFFAAVGSSSAGITIGNASSIAAPGGQLSIRGASSLQGGAGVAIGSSFLSGVGISVQGNDTALNGTGVDIFSSQLLASATLDVQGQGDLTGVLLSGADLRMRVFPTVANPAAALSIVGESLAPSSGESYGVYLDAFSATTFAPLSAFTGAGVSLRGRSNDTGVLVVDNPIDTLATLLVGGGGTVTIGEQLATGANSLVFEDVWFNSDGDLVIPGSTGITLSGSTLFEFDAGIAMRTSGNVSVASSDLVTTLSEAGIAISSTGWQSYNLATLTSNAGEITLDGDTVVVGASGVSFSAALVGASESTNVGIDITDSTLESPNGGVTVHGASLASGGIGVLIDGSTLSADRILVRSQATEIDGTGIDLVSSQLESTFFTSLQGRGDLTGVALTGDFSVRVGSALRPSSGTLDIFGEAVGAFTGQVTDGIYIDARLATAADPAPIYASDGAEIYLSGTGLEYGVRIIDNNAATRPTMAKTDSSNRIGINGDSTGGGFDGVLLDGVWIQGSGNFNSFFSSSFTLANGSLLAFDTGLLGANAINIDSLGTVTIDSSELSTAGSAVVMSLSGSSTGGGFYGIDIVDSTIDTGGGALLLAGAHPDSGFGIGVSIGGSTLTTSSLDIAGDAVNGYGVQILDSPITADNAAIAGVGTSYGIFWQLLEGLNLTISPGGTLDLYGEATGGWGVELFASSSFVSPAEIVATDASVQIYGSDPNNTAILINNVVEIDVGGGSLVIGDANANNVEIVGTRLLANGVGGSIALRSTDTLSLSDVQIEATGAVSLQSPNLSTGGTTTITSTALGDAIVLSGDATTPMSTWVNAADPLTLLQTPTPGGRWLAFLTDVGAANDYPSDLPYDFKLYNASPGDGAASAYAGNGLVFSTPQFATVTATVLPKTYDGTTSAGISNVGATGTNGDQVASASIVGGAVFATANAGTNIEVFWGGFTFDFEDGNGKPVYGYQYSSNFRGNIDPALLTVAVSVADKVYDASTLATSFGLITGGLVGTETLGVGTVAAFPVKDVGSYALSVDVLLTDGNNGGLASNYSVAPTQVASASITPATLVLGGLSADDKVYDATTVATLSGSGSLSPLGSDSVSLVGSAFGFFSDKNVGSAKSVGLSGFSLDGADAGNYTLLLPTLSASITPATLVVGGLSADDKVYNATTAATISGTASLTLLGEDSVSLAGSAFGFFFDKNVGNAKSVGVAGFSLDGADAGNYTLVQPTLSASITPATLLVSGLTVDDKVYDATTTAAISGTASLTAPLGSDLVFVSAVGSGSFSDKNAGLDKPVALSGLTLGGVDAGNYVVVLANDLSADITPASLVIGGLSADDKVYDGTTSATISGSASLTPLGSDSVSLLGSAFGFFFDKNVGSAKSVGLSGFSLDGADAGNYTLAQPTLPASITPATLVLGGLTANDKVYDATTAATISGSANLTAPLGSDSVGLAGSAFAFFLDKNVGSAKSVGLSGFSLDGADAGNYTLLLPTLAASITPATLVLSGLSADDKVYDATTSATISGSASLTPLGSDLVFVSAVGSGSFSDKNAGLDKPVALSGLTIGGADAGNYVVVLANDLSADITPATLLYVADPQSVPVGAPLPTLTGGVTGFLGDDTLSSETSGTLAFAAPDFDPTQAGTYAVDGSGLSAVNYVFEQAPGNASALAVVSTTDSTVVTEQATVVIDGTLRALAAPPTVSDPTPGGLLDLTASEQTVAGSAGGSTEAPSDPFQPIDLGAQSEPAVVAMLDARDLYKQTLFAPAISRLEQDAGLADVRDCRTLDEVESGDCLVTESLKTQWQAAAAASGGSSVVAPTPQEPQVSPAPSAPGSSGVAEAAAPRAPAPAVAAAAPVSPSVPSALEALLRGKRRVEVAAIPQISRKVALVIGVDDYKDPAIPKLANAVKDADAVGRLLESQLGYETVVLRNPTKAALIAALNKAALSISPSDSMVVYYAGHGWVVEKTNLGYWQLADSDASNPETWLSNTDIGKLVSQLGASQVALISDSCYSGSLVSNERIRAATGKVDPSQLLATRSVVVMSSGGNEPVADAGKNGNSPFAWNLMKTLGGLPEWQPGGNVFERVRFGVARELPQRPKYGAYVAAGHSGGGDYLFERRQLAPGPQ